MFVVGLDIGYSNLKIAYGDSSQPHPTIMSLPGGAAPLDESPRTLTGEVPDDLIQVMVDGAPWVAAVDHGRLQNATRQLHENFPSSSQYRALFYAALVQIGKPFIDVLVTGLPTAHYADAQRRAQLQESLSGCHKPAPGLSVEVGKVIVMPQPVGGYLSMLNETKKPEIVEQGLVLIADPGFFSFDWSFFEQGDLKDEQGGTSLNAVSVIIETALKLISEDYAGRKPALYQLERAIRAGQPSIYMGKTRLDVQPYLRKASQVIGSKAMADMETVLRRKGTEVTALHLVGGGAAFYLEAARQSFPNSMVSADSNPVLANVKGFWSYGQRAGGGK